jgi:hypothetical protein
MYALNKNNACIKYASSLKAQVLTNSRTTVMKMATVYAGPRQAARRFFIGCLAAVSVMPLAAASASAAGTQGVSNSGMLIGALEPLAGTPAESVAAAKELVEQAKVSVPIPVRGNAVATAAGDYARAVKAPTHNIYCAAPIIRKPFAHHVLDGAMAAA